MYKICHITTLHSRTDTRIFYKECLSLSKYYDVYLIVADGYGDSIVEGVNICDVGERHSSRFKRFIIDKSKALKKAKELDCIIYHIHDPELINIGVHLKKAGKKIVYDVHEDLPRQIYGKTYIKDWIKPIISWIIERKENKLAKKYDYICTATSHIRDRFLEINTHTVDINNYPIVNELINNKDWDKRDDSVCYIGGLSLARGVREIVDALGYLNGVNLILAGNFFDDTLKLEFKKHKQWSKVDFKGYVGRKGVLNILSQSKIGLVTLYPLINYQKALPVKMFEYMLAGIPVIVSNIKLWKSIVEDNNCGLSVDPFDAKDIANKIQYLIDNPMEAEKMGNNGKQAILHKYNWTIEEAKLISMYNSLLNI